MSGLVKKSFLEDTNFIIQDCLFFISAKPLLWDVTCKIKYGSWYKNTKIFKNKSQSGLDYTSVTKECNHKFDDVSLSALINIQKFSTIDMKNTQMECD